MAAIEAGRCSVTSRSMRKQKVRCLVAAAATAACGFSYCRAFATMQMVAQPAVDRLDGYQAETKWNSERDSKKVNEDALKNFALQLSDGFPGSTGASVGQGPPWAQCYAEADVKNVDWTDGSITQNSVLEQWVMRGDHQNTDAFMEWRKSMANGPVAIKCQQTTLKNVEDLKCLECVSHLGGYPFFSPSGSRISDLPQCMSRSFDGTGFCKSHSMIV